MKALKAHGRVGDAVTQHGVERVRETRQHGLLSFAALVGMVFELERSLQTPQLRTAHAGAALQLCEIDPFKGEVFTGLAAYFIERVGDPGFIIQIAFCIFHCTSFLSRCRLKYSRSKDTLAIFIRLKLAIFARPILAIFARLTKEIATL